MINKPKKYGALMPGQENHLFVAIEKTGDHIFFEGFFYAPLQELINRFSSYACVMAVTEEELSSRSFFFPIEMSVDLIYQEVMRQLGDVVCDVEIQASEEHPEEQWVIAYFLARETLKKYEAFGFKLVALEPMHLLDQRELSKDWQKKSIENIPREAIYEDIERALKLLDRENYSDA